MEAYGKDIVGDYRALHRRHRGAGDGRAADRGGAGAVAAALPAGRRRAARRWPPARTTRRWCSTRSWSGRCRWPAGSRRWPSARGAARPGPHRAFSVPAGGAVCADCRPAGSSTPDAESVALVVALLSGDWATAEASGAGGPPGGQRPGRRPPAVAPRARPALPSAGRASACQLYILYLCYHVRHAAYPDSHGRRWSARVAPEPERLPAPHRAGRDASGHRPRPPRRAADPDPHHRRRGARPSWRPRACSIRRRDDAGGPLPEAAAGRRPASRRSARSSSRCGTRTTADDERSTWTARLW